LGHLERANLKKEGAKATEKLWLLIACGDVNSPNFIHDYDVYIYGNNIG
jgi:hypothetical protein